MAQSDPDGILATPVATLARDEQGGADLDRIGELAAQTAALEVVVGLPRSLSGEEGVAAQRARDYAATLRRRLAPVAVTLFDERLTTVDAHRALRSSGVSGRQLRSRIDQAAAVLILQAALDAERTTGRPAGEPVGARKPRTTRSAARHEGTQP